MITKNVAIVNGISLQVVADGKEQLVAVKPVCEILGVAYQSQQAKLKEHPIYSSVITLSVTTGADGKKYEMVCIPLRFFSGWLFSINPDNVKEEVREKLIEYQQKWEEVSLWPKYCPFCGKPYDIKEIYGPDTVELKENLYCTHVELNNWDYDEEDQKRPITYELSFRYYGVEVSAYISIIRLQKHEVYFSMVECDGDLLEPFENLFRDSDELYENIFELCKKHWDEVEGEESEYEYDGTRHP